MSDTDAKPRPITDPLKIFIESNSVQNFILFVIVVNAIVLGLQTSRNLSEASLAMLNLIDRIAPWTVFIHTATRLADQIHEGNKDSQENKLKPATPHPLIWRCKPRHRNHRRC